MIDSLTSEWGNPRTWPIVWAATLEILIPETFLSTSAEKLAKMPVKHIHIYIAKVTVAETLVSVQFAITTSRKSSIQYQWCIYRYDNRGIPESFLIEVPCYKLPWERLPLMVQFSSWSRWMRLLVPPASCCCVTWNAMILGWPNGVMSRDWDSQESVISAVLPSWLLSKRVQATFSHNCNVTTFRKGCERYMNLQRAHNREHITES